MVRVAGFEPASVKRSILSALCMPFHHTREECRHKDGKGVNLHLQNLQTSFQLLLRRTSPTERCYARQLDGSFH